MSSILSRLLPAQRRWAVVLSPKPPNRSAHVLAGPWAPSFSAPSEVVAEAFHFPEIGDGFAPKPPKHLPPDAMPPDWTPRPRRSSARRPPSVYLSRTPASTTAGRSPSSGWPLFRGLLHSPASSGWQAPIHHPLQGGKPSVDNHSSSPGAMRPTLFRMAPQSPP